MPKADIGPKIGIEGEAEYRRELQSIQTGLKTLSTEMKVVTSEFANNEKSTEALTAKNVVLEKETYSLNEQLAKQEEYLEKVARAYGEANPKTQKAQQEVNKTKAALNQVNAEMKANSAQIEKNSTLLGKFGNSVGSVAKQLGLSSSATNTLTQAFSSGAGAEAAFATAIGVLSKKLVELSNEATRHGDQVATLATKYNTSVQSIQQFQYMANLVDVSVETVTGSISKLTKNMNSARDGTGAAAEAFAALGVSVTNSDGSLRSANDVFAEAIDALGLVGNETERDALAMQIFGKSAMELNPLIAQGSENLKALADEAANSGYVMSDKMIAVLQEGDDATQRLDRAMDGLKNTIGAGVTPVVAGWKMVLADAANDMAVFIQNLAGMRDGADEVTDAVNNATNALSNFKDITSAKDLMSQGQKDYVQYLNTMSDYYKSIGLSSGYVQDYGLWSENQQRMRSGERVVYDSSRSINVTVELDGKAIAQGTYDANKAESNRRGSSAYY